MQTPTSEQWERIQELFAELLECPKDFREGRMDKVCDDLVVREHVEKMLSSMDSEELPKFLESNMLAGLAATIVDDEVVLPVGKLLDDFMIVEELGRGGMGVVYRAQQRNPSREVAIKVIRPEAATPSVNRRFEHEADLLARMSHPGIAHIFGTGFVEVRGVRRPYFVMELVEGVPLTTYCRKNDLSVLDRLGLLAEVCDATQYAHQKGVIHRDLKPSNIIVDQSGRPKIIDFGVAGELSANTITKQYTAPGELLGTLVYMSPEQLSITATIPDTRSDVYALGVLAYEVLCETLPFEFGSSGILESIRVIEQQAHRPLSEHNASFKGDIETIIDKAIAKDRSQRYSSASDFAADLRRYLAHEPVLARHPTVVYRIRMYSKRNRSTVAGIITVLIAILIGLSGIFWQWKQTQMQVAMRDLAFRLFIGNVYSPNTEEQNTRALSDYQELADWLLQSPPLSTSYKLWMCDRIGVGLAKRGDHALSAQIYGLALDLSRLVEHQPLYYPDRATELYANALLMSGDPWRAIELASGAELELAPRLEDQTRSGVGFAATKSLSIRFYKLQLVRAKGMHDLGEFDQSERLLRELIEHFFALESDSRADEQWDVIESRVSLAKLLVGNPEGKADEGLEILEMVYEVIESEMPEHTIDLSGKLATLRWRMSEAHLKLGSLMVAQELARSALLVQIRNKRDRHPVVISIKDTLGRILLANGEVLEAEQLLRQVVEAAEEQIPGHWMSSVFRMNLGECLVARGMLSEARDNFIQAREGLVVFGEHDYRLDRVESLLRSLETENSEP